MRKTLTEIAQQLKDADKKVQLIYAFNGGGKTRLSREFKDLVEADSGDDKSNNDAEHSALSQKHILYSPRSHAPAWECIRSLNNG